MTRIKTPTKTIYSDSDGYTLLTVEKTTAARIALAQIRVA